MKEGLELLVWSVISKLMIGLLSLLVVVRFLGKKSLSALTPFDFVYTLVLGGILEESIYDDQVSIGHLLLGFALWALLIYLVEWTAHKSDRINKWLKGEPAVLIYDGKLVLEEIHKNKLEMEQIRELLRQEGCYSVRNAQYAVLETGGQLSVMQKKDVETAFSLLIVDEGRLEEAVLENWNMDDEQVKEELAKLGYDSIEDIVYAEWSEEEGFYAIRYDEVVSDTIRVDG